MSVTLAATYNPRGEIGRLQRLFPTLQSVYDDIVISMPPIAESGDVESVRALPGVRAFVNEEWSHGRYRALKAAIETGASHIHYADLDRLLRWVETRPDEWRRIVDAVGQCEYLVIGRTDAAWDTHPRALFETEKVQNQLFLRLLHQAMDIGAGSKGFCRAAAEFILANSSPGRAIGTDAEWTVLAHRGGFKIEAVSVDGLDWESADQNQEQAVDADSQRQAAARYDNDSAHWQYRVEVTQEVVESGLDALKRKLTGGKLRCLEVRRHTMRIKPGQRLSQSGVDLARRIGATIGPFDRVLTSTIPRAYETAVAMGFAVDEQLEGFATFHDGVENEVAWNAGFAVWADAAKRSGVVAGFVKFQADFWRSVVEALAPGERALIISHGGIVEAGAVGCMPDADHTAWGQFCSWCEGVRLYFDGERFVEVEILRVNESST